MAGRTIGGYELLAEIGGLDRVVFRARNPEVPRVDALKTLAGRALLDGNEFSRLLREARCQAAVCHPNVIRMHMVGQEADGLPFLVMELAEGGDLAARLDANPWPVARAASFVAGVARALQAVHRLGIVHRSVQPEHILLTRDGEPKLSGFRYARPVEQPLAGDIEGDPAYLSPEQVGRSENPDRRSDIWSLGILLYRLLVGRLPFEAASGRQVIRRVMEGAPTPLRQVRPDMPTALEAVCMRCLEKDPSRRWASAEEFVAHLEPFARPASAGLWRRLGLR